MRYKSRIEVKMFKRLKKQELKIHILFAGIFFLILTVTAGIKIWNGTDTKTAIWQTLAGISLMEIALFIGFWHHAIKKTNGELDNSVLTTLHLND